MSTELHSHAKVAAGASDLPAPSHELSDAFARVPGLDGLRSIVVLIMLWHFGQFEEPPLGEWYLRGLVYVTQYTFGMDVFFVLSGFLITRILLDTRSSPSYYRTFFARRALRILPVYYGFIFLYVMVLPYFLSLDPNDRISGPHLLLYCFYLQNFWIGLGRAWFPGAGAPWRDTTEPLWSLAVEEQFYLVWPVVVRTFRPERLRQVCLACVVAAPLIRIVLAITLGPIPGAAFFLTPARIDGLALGAVMALAARTPSGLTQMSRWLRPAAILGVVALVLIFWRQQVLEEPSYLLETFSLTASVYVGAGLVLLALTSRKRDLYQRVLESWPLRTIGRYSYAIYVLHVPLAYLLGRWGLVTHDWFADRIASRLGVDLAYSGIMIVLSIIAGAASWHFIESPILKLKRHLPYSELSRRA